MNVASTDWDRLVAAARYVSQNAYAPYSHFFVGAALLTKDGEVLAGCNVENASFGMTICAERNAVFHAVAAGRLDFAAMVVYTPTPTPSTPCGACRQVLHEFAPDMPVRCVCDGPGVITMTVRELLPAAFGPESL